MNQSYQTISRIDFPAALLAYSSRTWQWLAHLPDRTAKRTQTQDVTVHQQRFVFVPPLQFSQGTAPWPNPVREEPYLGVCLNTDSTGVYTKPITKQK